MNAYDAGSPASAAAELKRRLALLVPGGPAVQIDPDTFLRATRLGFDPHSEAAILDSIPVVPADNLSAAAFHDQPTAQATAEAPAPADTFSYQSEQPGPDPITVESTVGLDWSPEPLSDALLHLLVRLRKTLGRQIIAGRGSGGELRGLLHLQGVQRPEYGNLLDFAVSGAVSQAWDDGGCLPAWVALNPDDIRDLPGTGERESVTGVPIIRSPALPRETIVTGACSPLTIRLSLQSPRVWIEPERLGGRVPIVAAVHAELDHLRPSAFVVAQFGKAPVIDFDNLPKIEATPEEWAELDRILRESRGRARGQQ